MFFNVFWVIVQLMYVVLSYSIHNLFSSLAEWHKLTYTQRNVPQNTFNQRQPRGVVSLDLIAARHKIINLCWRDVEHLIQKWALFKQIIVAVWYQFGIILLAQMELLKCYNGHAAQKVLSHPWCSVSVVDCNQPVDDRLELVHYLSVTRSFFDVFACCTACI